VRYPHRPIDRGSADRTIALGQNFARPATKSPFGVGAEQVKVFAAERVEHPWGPVAGAYLA